MMSYVTAWLLEVIYVYSNYYDIKNPIIIESIRLNIKIIIVDPSWDQTICEQDNIFVC